MTQQRPLLQANINALEPMFKTYLPKELVPAFMFFDRKLVTDNIKYPKAEMYGTPQELIKTVRNFFDFPGSHDKFKMELTFPRSTKPNTYKSFKKEEYVYKQELFIHLLLTVPHGTFAHVENGFIFSILTFFLNTKENLLKNVFELVALDTEKLDVLEKKVAEKLKNLNNLLRKSEDKLKPTLVEIFSKLKEILPANEKDPEYLSILSLLEKFEKEKPIKKNLKLYESMITWIRAIIEELSSFIEQNPKWFLPKSECAQNPEDPIIVRVFDSMAQKSVMEYELIGLLEDLDEGKIKETFERRGILTTIKINEVLVRLGKNAKNVEFVVIPIRLTQQGAIFLPSFNGKHCILSFDLLLEVLRDMASIKNVFQKINKSNSEIVIEMFYKLRDVFDCNMEEQYFIDTDKAAEVKKFCFKYLNEHMKDLLKDTKDVRKVGKTGFTLDDLKSEMLYLGIDGAFPEILLYAEKGYDVALKTKQTEVLRTRDMYTALEECQFMAFFVRFPTLFQFNHLQKTCKYMLITCPFCTGRLPVKKFANGPCLASKCSKNSDDIAPSGSE